MYTIKRLDTWLSQQENEERTGANIHTDKLGSGGVCSLRRETPTMIPKHNLEAPHFHYIQHSLWMSLNLIGHLCGWVPLESKRSKLQFLYTLTTFALQLEDSSTNSRPDPCVEGFVIVVDLRHAILDMTVPMSSSTDSLMLHPPFTVRDSSDPHVWAFIPWPISPGPINNFWKRKYYSKTMNIFPDQIDIKFSGFVIIYLSIHQFYALKISLMYILIYSICKVVSDTFKVLMPFLLLFRLLNEIEDFLLVLDVIRVIFTKPVH